MVSAANAANEVRRGSSAHVDDYISTRRGEGAGEHTISKELVALRASLKIALRRGLWRGIPEAVCPIAFAPEYKPRTRFLSQAELQRLLSKLPGDRAAAVAFMVATSAEWGAVKRAERDDVSIEALARARARHEARDAPAHRPARHARAA